MSPYIHARDFAGCNLLGCILYIAIALVHPAIVLVGGVCVEELYCALVGGLGVADRESNEVAILIEQWVQLVAIHG